MFKEFILWLYAVSPWLLLSFVAGFAVAHFPDFFREYFRSFSKKELIEIGTITYKVSLSLYLFMLFFIAHILLKLVIIYFVLRILHKRLQGADVQEGAGILFHNLKANVKRSNIFIQLSTALGENLEYHKKTLFASSVFLLFSFVVYSQASTYLSAYGKTKNLKVLSDSIIEDRTNHILWQNDNSNQRLKYYEAVEYCENLNVEGYEKWRLPKYQELISVLDYDKKQTTFLDTFKDGENRVYLSGDRFGEDGLMVVNFSNASGHALNVLRQMNIWEMKEKSAEILGGGEGSFFEVPANFSKNYDYDNMINPDKIKKAAGANPFKEMRALNIKCVKDIDWKTHEKMDFYKENNSVKNEQSGLIWQDSASVRTENLSYDQAQEYCNNLTLNEHNNWRLPTVKELESILRFDNKSKITSEFTHVSSNSFWSSTKGHYSNSKRVINFGNGEVKSLIHEKNAHVRCVSEPWALW
jgi:hypothetical protein